MPAVIGSGVTLRGFEDEKYTFTWNISGTTVAADVNKAVSQDITADETAKLCADGEVILGQLRSFENRVQEGIQVGAVKMKGTMLFTYTGTAPVKGNSVVGSATPGVVKAAAASAYNKVLAVYTGNSTVLVLMA